MSGLKSTSSRKLGFADIAGPIERNGCSFRLSVAFLPAWSFPGVDRSNLNTPPAPQVQDTMMTVKTRVVFAAAIALRAGLIYFGYIDIDYLVFTDAARFVSRGRSPYDRATYRYTPLLAWLLYPTTWPGFWFEFGKVLFCAADVLTGWLIIRILQKRMSTGQATNYACIWVLNPMVASISARGSSEGLVALVTMALLWAALERRSIFAGCLLGFAVHFKIYPFIYAASVFWWMGPENTGSIKEGERNPDQRRWLENAATLFTPARRRLVLCSAFTFTALNVVMLNV